MQELKQKALGGEKLGDLNTVISKLEHGGSKLVYLSVPLTLETGLGQRHRLT